MLLLFPPTGRRADGVGRPDAGGTHRPRLRAVSGFVQHIVDYPVRLLITMASLTTFYALVTSIVFVCTAAEEAQKEIRSSSNGAVAYIMVCLVFLTSAMWLLLGYALAQHNLEDLVVALLIAGITCFSPPLLFAYGLSRPVSVVQCGVISVMRSH